MPVLLIRNSARWMMLLRWSLRCTSPAAFEAVESGSAPSLIGYCCSASVDTFYLFFVLFTYYSIWERNHYITTVTNILRIAMKIFSALLLNYCECLRCSKHLWSFTTARLICILLHCSTCIYQTFTRTSARCRHLWSSKHGFTCDISSAHNCSLHRL